jgi:hypothetical protein
MSDRILLIMPTRGRPWSALEAIASVMKNATEPDSVEIVIIQDEDDRDQFEFSTFGNIQTHILPRYKFIQSVNIGLAKRKWFFEWVAWLGDDCRYLTPRWDDLLREHKELVVFGPDGHQDERMATHPFIRKCIPESLGYLLPQELIHGCADTFIEALAREIGSIAYDPRIKMEHLHPTAGKGKMDQTYLDAQQVWEQDKKTMAEVIMPRIPELAAKVKATLC